MAFFGRFIMLYSIKPLHLHCVFHGIRFKVNKDWVSGIDTLLFYIPIQIPFLPFQAYETGCFCTLFQPSEISKNPLSGQTKKSDRLFAFLRPVSYLCKTLYKIAFVYL